MKNKKYSSAFAAGLLCLTLLAGCQTPNSANDTGDASKQITTSVSESGVVDMGKSITNVSYETSDDNYYFGWKSSKYTAVNLAKGSYSIIKSGIYELSGTLSDGSVSIDIDKSVDKGTVYLVLNAANINSKIGTPINIIEAKKVVIILENSTTNTVTQGAITTVDTEFPSAAIFSKADMTITGGGTLTVTTLYNDGITSKDELIITDGNITVNAASDGIVGKDLLAVEKATINILSGKDGLRSTNETDEGKGNIEITSGTFAINCKDDGIHAENAVTINGGSIDIKSCYEGIEGKSVTITNGKVSVVSSDDGLNVSVLTGTMAISGGEISIASGGDSVDSNGNLTITGGEITINSSTIGKADGSIDYDGTLTFTGGTIVDQNGTAIDPTVLTGRGGGMGGARPKRP